MDSLPPPPLDTEDDDMVAASPSKQNVVVYLLCNETGRTYVGCTVNATRRLRQHNGELVGGAAQTSRGRPWHHVLLVQGFVTLQQGLQFEYAWRRVHRRHKCPYTVTGRRRSLELLMKMERWSRNAPLAAEVPLLVTE